MELVARELPPGTLLHGRYLIQNVIGAGGFGITYLATDMQGEQRPVAVKEYMPLDVAVRAPGSQMVVEQQGKKEQYERFRSRFLEEAKLIYRYRNHPNIVRVYHLFYENNTAYYIMEYMVGEDFGKVLKRNGPLSWNYIRNVMEQAVRALAALHESGIVHCDISPDNLFLLQDGTVKLIDFGAAKSVMSGQSSVIILKKGFAPLEQYKSRGNLGSWTDIYALAVTVYLSITGIMPPPSTERAVKDNIRWTQELGIAAPTSGWEPAMKKALAIYPEYRYSDVLEFWQDLIQEEMEEYPVLEGIRGAFDGQRLQCFGELLVGVDRQSCQLCYPAETAGISRKHLRLWCEEGKLLVMDMGSTYGSFLNGAKMTPGLVYTAEPGAVIELGKNQMFRYVSKEKLW